MKKNQLALLILLLQFNYHIAQEPLKKHPISTESEIGMSPCNDIINVLGKKHPYDIGIALPSWRPVVDADYVGILEGKVAYNNTGSEGPHVSGEDFPFYHYSHDFDFDIIPDSTPDNRFTNYLPYLVNTYKDKPNDTTLSSEIHIEWESGVGMGNRINPIRTSNDKGQSGGFFSAGHERGDLFWNWATAGDWAHVEGNLIWDRGHPPANVEIHPARLIALKRNLPDHITLRDSSKKFATRIDVFANGDGGALRNNRKEVSAFVKTVKMSSKDYEFTIQNNLPRPSPTAQLAYLILKRKGDNFPAKEIITINETGTAHILIPWKTMDITDTAIYARTIYLYWNESNGVAPNYTIDKYTIHLTNLFIKKSSEIMGRSENRLFAEVGGQWIFVNDYFAKRNKELTAGMGKSFKKHWKLDQQFVVYLPHGKSFRVWMAGWEADGIDRLMGDLFDSYSTCTAATKHFFKHRLFSFGNVFIRGCLDDEYGVISNLHSADQLQDFNTFTNSPHDGKNDDPCPFSKYPLKDRYFLTYTVEKESLSKEGKQQKAKDVNDFEQKK